MRHRYAFMKCFCSPNPSSFVRNLLSTSLVIVVFAISTNAQSYVVLHSFTGGLDGGGPLGKLIIDNAGNIYGTTYVGGLGVGYGGAFVLRQKNGAFIFSRLYDFQAGNDGRAPIAGLTFGHDGSVYGVTQQGGGFDCSSDFITGCGTAFRLKPPPTFCRSAICPWNETQLHAFTGYSDGIEPVGNLIVDQNDNLYGTTMQGGAYGQGTVFELTPSGSGWTKTIIYSFGSSGIDGLAPFEGVVFDAQGNLYGTTSFGGTTGNGTVFELSPSGSGWTETILHNFTLSGPDGGEPVGIVFGPSGNLYGLANGQGSAGVAYELVPTGGGWTFNVIYDFQFDQGAAVTGTPTIDATENLYGAASGGGKYGAGNVFKLTMTSGTWSMSSLYDFQNGSDGAQPFGGVAIGADGSLYGTASRGGLNHTDCGGIGCGVVFRITP